MRLGRYAVNANDAIRVAARVLTASIAFIAYHNEASHELA